MATRALNKIHVRALLCILALAASSPARALSLDECRESARQSHPRRLQAEAAVRAAEARSLGAISGYLPDVAGDLSWTASNGSGSFGARVPAGTTTTGSPFFGPPDVQIFGAGLTVRQTIFDFGRSFFAWRAAQGTAEAARAERALAEEIVDVDAEATFRGAIAAFDLVAAAEFAKAAALRHRDRAQARATVGLAQAYDVARADVDVQNAELSLVGARNQAELVRRELARACALDGLRGDEPLVPAAPRAVPSTTDLQPRIDAAVARRPEVALAKRRVEAAVSSQRAAWATWFPSLDAVGGVSYRGLAIDQMQPGWSAGLTLSVPLLAGGADLARVHEADAQALAADPSLTAARRDARITYEIAALAVVEAAARKVAAQRLVGAAEQGMELAEARAEAGLADALVLSDANSALAQARAALVRATLDEALTALRLDLYLSDPAEQR